MNRAIIVVILGVVCAVLSAVGFGTAAGALSEGGAVIASFIPSDSPAVAVAVVVVVVVVSIIVAVIAAVASMFLIGVSLFSAFKWVLNFVHPPPVPPIPGLPDVTSLFGSGANIGATLFGLLLMTPLELAKLPPNIAAFIGCLRACLCKAACNCGDQHVTDPVTVVGDAGSKLIDTLRAALEEAKKKLDESRRTGDWASAAYWAQQLNEIAKRLHDLGDAVTPP